MTRRLQRALVALLTVGVVLAGTGARAEASTSWRFDDGFETSGSAWYDDGDGPLDCPAYRTCNPAYVVDDPASAYRGAKYGFIGNNSGYAANWLSLGRSVRIAAGSTSCSMAAWIDVDYARATPVTLKLEVIRTSTWTYETLNTIQLTDLSQVGTWHRYSSGTWAPRPRDVTIRFVVVGQDWGVVNIRVDDVTVSCTVG